MKRYLGHINPQPIIRPGVTTAAGTGDRVSMANYDSIVFVAYGADSTATADLAASLQQHTANSGGTSKALVPRTYYRKQTSGDVTVDGDYTAVAPSTQDGVADAVLMESDMGQIVAVEVTADELDVSGGFNYVSMNLSAGDAAKIVGVIAILCGARYAVEPTEYPAVD